MVMSPDGAGDGHQQQQAGERVHERRAGARFHTLQHSRMPLTNKYPVAGTSILKAGSGGIRMHENNHAGWRSSGPGGLRRQPRAGHLLPACGANGIVRHCASCASRDYGGRENRNASEIPLLEKSIEQSGAEFRRPDPARQRSSRQTRLLGGHYFDYDRSGAQERCVIGSAEKRKTVLAPILKEFPWYCRLDQGALRRTWFLPSTTSGLGDGRAEARG